MVPPSPRQAAEDRGDRTFGVAADLASGPPSPTATPPPLWGPRSLWRSAMLGRLNPEKTKEQTALEELLLQPGPWS